MSEKTFYIQLEKYSLQVLKDVLSRILSVDTARDVMERLPNQGQNLQQFRATIEKEIKLREGLNRTKARVEELAVKCASDTNLGAGYEARLSSLDRRPIVCVPPVLPIKLGSSGHTESTSAIPDEEKEMAAQNNGMKMVKGRLMGILDNYNDSLELSSSSSSTSSSDSDPPEFFHVIPNAELHIFQAIKNPQELEKVVKNYIFSRLTQENQYEANRDHSGPSGVQLQDEAAAFSPKDFDAPVSDGFETALSEKVIGEGPKQNDEAESPGTGHKHPRMPEEKGDRGKDVV